jgi:site-specific DNA-methyltransferase (adenine-specific)
MQREVKTVLYNDNYQNWKRYGIPKANLVLTDVPYNVGTSAFASNPQWWIGGDRKNGADPKKAGKAFFNTDYNFNIVEYFAFCNRLLKKEPKERGQAPCMIVFCAAEQVEFLIETAKKYGFKNHQRMYFVKNYSPQVLKSNQRMVGATEQAVLLYRDKLPKFNNNGMVFDWFEWVRDGKDIPRISPVQKPVNLLKRLIEIYTDPGDVVIDPCAGSGSTLRAARELGRHSYGFEISKDFYRRAVNEMLNENYIKEEIAGQVTLFDLMEAKA